MPSFDEIKANAKPGTRSVKVCTDQTLNDEYDRLTSELEQALRKPTETLDDSSPSRDLARQVQELEQQMRDHQVELKLRILTNRQFAKILDDHPPRVDKDGKANVVDEGKGFNVETFPPALLAAAAVDPELTLEQADELFFDILTGGDADHLQDVLLRDSVIPSRIPFSVTASQVLRATEPSSPQPNSGE